MISTNRTNNFASFGSQAEDQYSVRLASVHFCAPDTTVHHFIAAIARLRAGSQLRLKFKTHYGKNSMSCFFLVALLFRRANSFSLSLLFLFVLCRGERRTAILAPILRYPHRVLANIVFRDNQDGIHQTMDASEGNAGIAYISTATNGVSRHYRVPTTYGRFVSTRYIDDEKARKC